MSCLRSAHHGRRWLSSPGSRRRQAAGRGISTAADASASDPMRATSIPHGPSAQRGIALVLVLWLTVMLTVIAGSFAYGMRNEALAARNALSWAQARALADGAIHRTAFELLRPKVSPDVWTADGSVRVWDDAGSQIAVSAIDESGKIDLNTAPDALLKGLLMTAGGLDEPSAVQLVDVIGDWKDADDLRRPNGAEAADYKAAGLPYLPANSFFETVAEVQRVLGMTPALYAKLADNLTV